MSYYHDKLSATEKFLWKRKYQLEYKLRYWTELNHFSDHVAKRAVKFINAEMKLLKKCLREASKLSLPKEKIE